VDVYQGTLEAMPDPAMLLDSNGQIVATNAVAERAVGWPRSGLVGQRLAKLVPEALRDRLPLPQHNGDGEALGAGLTRLDLRIQRKDGTEFPAEMSLGRVGDQRPPLVLAVIHEIADKAQSGPAEVQRLKEMAEFRARFLNMAAHELKTPLTPIRMQIQILQSYLQNQPENVTRSMGILKRSVERLHTLIEDVLDAARIQAARLRMRQEPVSLTDTVREAVETYAAVAQELDLRLTVDVDAEVTVVGDRGRLMQVLNNLLSNAIKFTPARGEVQVHLRRSDGWAVLEVRDSGRGMTMEQVGRLFQPFTQVHADLEATQKGTGLGLYITKGIVDQHGGTIAIASRGEGAGTRVAVRLPTTTQRAVAPEPHSPRRRQQLSERLREMV